MGTYQRTSTNHKWNVLNIMRYYTRINKPFNAEVYVKFIGVKGETPDELGGVDKIPVPISKISEIIRRYVSNGWAVRNGSYVTITPKGTQAMVKYEKVKYKKDASVSSETLRRREKRRL